MCQFMLAGLHPFAWGVVVTGGLGAGRRGVFLAAGGASEEEDTLAARKSSR